MCRVSDADIARTGKWANSALALHYLPHAPATALMVLAGFPMDGPNQLQQSFWAERFNITIPPDVLEACRLHIYPWLAIFRTRVSQVSFSLAQACAVCLA
jgi:hypothetical protein